MKIEIERIVYQYKETYIESGFGHINLEWSDKHPDSVKVEYKIKTGHGIAAGSVNIEFEFYETLTHKDIIRLIKKEFESGNR